MDWATLPDVSAAIPPTQPAPSTQPAPPLWPAWAALVLALALIAADQALKHWAMSHLQEGQLVRVLPGVLGWYLTYNTGAAWSMFSGAAPVLALGRLLIGLGVLVYLMRKPQPVGLGLPLTLIAAGAVGNAIDGLSAGKVTDMLYSPLLSQVTQAIGQGDFPIFNVADSCVVGGTILLLTRTLLHKEPPAKTE